MVKTIYIDTEEKALAEIERLSKCLEEYGNPTNRYTHSQAEMFRNDIARLEYSIQNGRFKNAKN